MRARSVTAAVGVGLASGYAALQVLGRRWGATSHELHQVLPGDDIVDAPIGQTTHGITIDASPAEVWPWLVQMGYHRGGWYTPAWVDRVLFEMSNPSAEEIIPELQHVGVGDIIPDGPPDTAWYVIDQFAPGRHLVLHSTTHLPPAWREDPGSRTWVDWTWAFVLHEREDGRTRLVVRVRGACGPGWLRAIFLGAIVPADFVMARSMLRGIRDRAERTRARPRAGSAVTGGGAVGPGIEAADPRHEPART